MSKGELWESRAFSFLAVGVAFWAPMVILNSVWESKLAVGLVGLPAGIILTLGVLIWRSINLDIREQIAKDRKKADNLLKAEAQERERNRAKRKAHQLAESQYLRHDGPQEILEKCRDAGLWLLRADEAFKNAERCFRDGAYTPFWEEIERSLEAMSHHRSCIALIATSLTEMASRREKAKDWLPHTGGDVAPIPELAAVADTRAHERLAERIGGLVYQAQRDRDFATIFEQRRTTSAVYSGFNSVSAALGAVSTAIDQAHSEMKGSAASWNQGFQKRGPSLDEPIRERAAYGSLIQEVRDINQTLKRLSV